MTTTEQERAAYMAGDTRTADLLARIDDLQRALGESVAENETLRDEYNALIDQRDELRDEFDTFRIEHMRPLCHPCDTEFTFRHANGDDIVCYLEYDAGDPSEPERMTLIDAYIGAVNVLGILPVEIVEQIENQALKC